jgi:transcriptional regulator with XRE-family HTH domain
MRAKKGVWSSSDEIGGGLNAARLVAALTAARKARHLTPRAVADTLIKQGSVTSLSDQAVSHWEVRNSEPSLDQFREWARALGLLLIVELVPRGGEFWDMRVRSDLGRLVRRMNRGLRSEDIEIVTRLVRLVAMLPRDGELGARARRWILDDLERFERELTVAAKESPDLYPEPDDA